MQANFIMPHIIAKSIPSTKVSQLRAYGHKAWIRWVHTETPFLFNEKKNKNKEAHENILVRGRK